VKRFVSLSDTSSTTSTSSGVSFGSGGCYPGLVTQYFPKNGFSTITQSAGERWWAEARFRYWLPEGPRDVKWKRNMAARLYGLNPSPSVIYNAIPWTWLADWFSNAGDVVANLDVGVADRLAADYAYMMRSNYCRAQHCLTWHMKRKDGSLLDFVSTTHSERSYKTLIHGNPFGFSAKDNLSGMQLSILGALGLSRI
jgi:hypothetical protein